jgi:hypothetical protein
MTTAAVPVVPQTHDPRRAWTGVILLAVVGTLNYADRFLPAVLTEPIKAELSLSDTAIGVINGFGFLAVYAVLRIAIAHRRSRQLRPGHLGLLIVGRLADRLSGNDFRWLLWLVAAMTAAMFISLSYVVGTAYMAPSIAAIQRLARAEQRATASAIFLFFSAIVRSAGPFLTGVISDALKPELGNMALGRALLIVPVMQLVAVACYLVASRRFA